MNLAPTPMLASFADAFGIMEPFYSDELQDICFEVNEVLILFTFTLAFAGLLVETYKGIRGGNLEGIFGHLVATGVVCVIMPFFPVWVVEDIRTTLSDDLLDGLDLDPIGLMERFGDSFGDLDIDTDPGSLFSGLLINPLAIIDYIANIIAAFCMIIIGLLCYIVFFFAYQVQIFALYVGCAVSPIFFGMFLFEETKKTAVNYFIGLIAICFWPLGWGIGLLLADFLLQIGIDIIIVMTSTLVLGGLGVAITTIAIFCLVIAVAVWIMFVLFKAPQIIQSAIVSGAQIGLAFASNAVSAGTAGAGAGVAAASSVAGMVPGVGGTASKAINAGGSMATGFADQVGGIAGGGGGGGDKG